MCVCVCVCVCSLVGDKGIVCVCVCVCLCVHIGFTWYLSRLYLEQQLSVCHTCTCTESLGTCFVEAISKYEAMCGNTQFK